MKIPSQTLQYSAVFIILVVGLSHLLEIGDAFEEATYKGLLFAANSLGCLVTAIVIYRTEKTWGWLLGFIISVSSIVGYIISRTLGLPGIPAEPDAWFEPLGVVSLLSEGIFIVIFILSAKRRFNGSNLQH